MTSARSFANRYLQTDCSKGNDIKYIIFARMFRPLHDWWPIFDHCGYRINKWWFFIGLFTDCPSRTCREHLLVLRGLALELNRLRSFYLLLIGHLWMPEESVDLGYSFEWLAESLQIMMVLQETDLPPPALLGLQLSHYMDWFSSGHRRVLMHENYVQTNHAKDKTQSYVFFCSPSWPVKTTGHSWLRNNKPRDRIKGTYLLSESVRWYPSKDLIDTNFQVIFQFSAVCDVGSWYVVLEKHWHLHFSMLSFIVLFWLTYKPHKHKNKRQPKKTRKRKRPIEPECQSVTVVFVCLVSVLCCLLFT